VLLQVVDPVAAAQPAARSKDLMRAMKEAAQGMRGGREVGELPGWLAAWLAGCMTQPGLSSDTTPCGASLTNGAGGNPCHLSHACC